MLAVDTNIVVRILVGDDPVQSQIAAGLFRKHPIFIAQTVLLETEWVLRSAYKFSGKAIGAAFRGLAGVPNVTMENPWNLEKALRWHAEGMDFADAIHLTNRGKATEFVTFDNRLVKKAKALSLGFVKQAR